MMLIINTKPGQTVQVGKNITVTVTGITEGPNGQIVSLGFRAPRSIPIQGEWMRPKTQNEDIEGNR